MREWITGVEMRRGRYSRGELSDAGPVVQGS
jgi:hypothetical protein